MIKYKKIAITIGDPTGIGPEIIIKSINSLDIPAKEYILIGNKEIFHKVSSKINQPLPDNLDIIDIPCDISKISAGQPNIESGKLSYLALKKACQLAQNNEIRAIVTAPLSKEAINMAGYHYSGQTEILQDYLGNKNEQAEMLFVARDFRVLLLTRHIPLKDVPQALTQDKIINTILALNKSLTKDFNTIKPRLAVCGLNPHAGENGLLGTEEQEIIIPAINKLKEKYNINIEGPFPADTMWNKAAKPYIEENPQPYQAYVACYHDQGLIPIKLLAMDFTVNMTINLPIIRTSPSHGTAFDIASKNIANYNSMKEAIDLAYSISV
ncbi:MAG: 4-hydroxythreonine-4-phosphate dehydrogenase PdxA [Candidatus Melainabacteria bacterium RIFOXYA12_FULL_32_12]|nr:MAG: 4-hydroxythreonine-4-phosphate dehydrogenase PdxA [Candidatus Melainabacteria bacterium RIFOXYA2_FULL_32_9]OGI31591.1 MAG: 4-hydroxythreonine-4-phosphate dehydrogenase PdxA [Candidatus Melainabacteria bacterium RIFOXYA12_FULL_32_12]